MKKNQNQSLLILGGNSEIGNAIIKSTGFGSRRPKVFFSRSSVGSEFQNHDIIVEFDALNLDKSVVDLNQYLNTYDIDCVVISYASTFFGNIDDIRSGIFINFTSTVILAETVIEYFTNRNARTAASGTIIFVSSSIVSLKPRKKNFRYAATKIAADFYLRGLRNEVAVKDAKINIRIVRPGFTKTKIHHNEKPAPFSSDVEKVGKSIAYWIDLGFITVYAPILIKIPIFILSLLPPKILNFLDEFGKVGFNYDKNREKK